MVLIPRHSESLVTGSNRSGRRSPCRRSPGCSIVGTLGQTLRLGLVHRTELVGRSSRAANVFAASACMPVALWGRTFGRSVRLCSPDIGRAACSNSRPCRPSACTPHSSAAATPGTREPAPGRPVGDDFGPVLGFEPGARHCCPELAPLGARHAHRFRGAHAKAASIAGVSMAKWAATTFRPSTSRYTPRGCRRHCHWPEPYPWTGHTGSLDHRLRTATRR